MADYGAKVADKAISETEKKLRKVYEKAAEELRKKLVSFNERFAKKQTEMRAKLEAGEVTKAAYESWLRGQVFIGRQWAQKADQAARIMTDANKEAALLVGKGKLNVFAENYNYTAYELEKKAGAFLNFNLYDEKAVEKLIRKKPKMLPEWKIDEPKDYKWNRQKVENSITQGIIQGKRIDEIMDDLVSNLCTTNDNKMRTFARTAMTGAQNAGRQAQMEDAEDMGIKLKKRWLATLDDRTRDLHQELDGQEVPVNEPFHVGIYKIDYPGDPNGEPEMVYNCRCTMIEIYEGIDRKSVRRDMDDNEIEDMTYKEWKKWKEGGAPSNGDKLDQSVSSEKSTDGNIIQGATRHEILEKTMAFNDKANELASDIKHLDEEYSELYSKSLVKYGTDEYDGIEYRMRKIEEETKGKRDALERIWDERDAYLTNKDESVILDAFGKIEGKHSIEDDVKSVNVITSDIFTQRNCGSCSLAYDARRRGIDCEAILSQGTNTNEIEKWWDGLKFQTASSYYPSDAMKEIEEYAIKCGNGSRGVVDVRYSPLQGHVFSYEVRDGRCIFLDGQTGIFDASINFEGAMPGTVKYGRTDDKELTRYALLELKGKKNE